MMATSIPNFAGHPAAMGHPVAGHPMAPGMPPNAGQQGAPGGGMPHQFVGGHMAVSGPGPQVNPALMGGIPPGANHNVHGMQHMSPAQQQMLQQQHMQQFNAVNAVNNPSAMAALRQQQMLQQQQRQQALMAQQAFQIQGVNRMPINMGPMTASQLTPQQMHQLQAAGRYAGSHPQLIAQQMAIQQQQQAAQAQQQAQQQAAQVQAQQQAQQQAAHGQQMTSAHNPAQHMAMSAQGMPNMQQQNPMAAGAQTPMGGQQQPGQQPQGQPQQQSQPQQQPQQQAQQQQQQQQQPSGPQSQQTPQQTSQAGTPAPTGQQTPSQTPAPTPVQPSQMPQGQPQPQPQQAQAQAQTQAQAQPQMSAAQQQQLMALQQHSRREQIKMQCMMKLTQFGERLSGFTGSTTRKDDLLYWNTFVSRFFASPLGVFRHSLHISSDAEDPTDKQYEISFPVIPRYFQTHFNSGVRTMQLLLDGTTTEKHLPGECICLENAKANLVYWFESGSHLVATGTLRVQFDGDQKIELFEFLTTKHEEFISRKQVLEAAKPAHLWIKDWHKANAIDSKQSPEMSKKGKARQLKSAQKGPPEVLADLPDSAVNSKGVTEAVHQFLEIVEVMGQMNPLFSFYHSNPGMSPYVALEQYVTTQIGAGGATPVMNGQPMQGPRTPSFSQFPMGASPAAAHMNLPGSPHMGSPAPGQMQAPGMQLQPSQQGTSSSGPSTNTSPASSNKRRRPSTVKAEEDVSGAGTPASSGQVNGIQRGNKPPTPRIAKRHKGNPT